MFYIPVNLSHSENNYIQLKYRARLFQYFVFKKALDYKWLNKVLIIKDFIQLIPLSTAQSCLDMPTINSIETNVIH